MQFWGHGMRHGSRVAAATVLAAAGLAALVEPAHAAAALDGRAMGLAWCLPFAGLLLSIATGPVFYPHVWEHHYGKIAALWAALVIVPMLALFPFEQSAGALTFTMLGEYLPFIILIFALYAIAGGILVTGNIHGAPGTNTAILAIGAVLASFVGTTGASMIMIRPIIRANDDRVHNVHVVVFFIFIVSNCGGALTPLGDPPLFVGFLKGVDFFWTVKHIFPETLFLVGALLAIFYVLDSWYYHRREEVLAVDPTPDTRGIGFDGAGNFWLLAAIVGLVLMSGFWKSPVSFNIMGTDVGLPGLLRDAGLIAVTLLSLKITADKVHQDNQFSWGPMAEVAKLFAGIFLTIIPVIAMLKAGVNGPFGPVVAAVTRPDGSPDPAMYFWATGALSSFLDNAPTYLVFFNTAGGDPAVLMTTLAPTLAAISAGAVFMGANTYIGNAPNLMVKAIAEDRGVKMPSFFGYMAWSGAVLIPLFIAMTFIWFR